MYLISILTLDANSKLLKTNSKSFSIFQAAQIGFGPYRHSAHFRLSIGSHLRLPSATLPLRPRRRAVRYQLPPSSAREEPNRSIVMPPSLPPLNRRGLVSSSPFNSFETSGD
jgi:hypothetical protein